jgi:hypothetical protein
MLNQLSKKKVLFQMDLGSTAHLFISLVSISLIEMLHLIGGLIIIGFCLGVMEGFSNRLLVQTFGIKGIFFTAWIGTPIHELSHAFMCLIFHHRVKKIKLLQLNSPDGRMGYVEHQYDPGSLYQKIGNFFIGTAPIVGGTFAIFLCMYFTVPDSFRVIIHYLKSEVTGDLVTGSLKIAVSSILLLIKSLFSFHHLLEPLFWIFLILSICISSNMALSKSDMRGATSGITAFFLFILFLNGVVRLIHFAPNQINVIIGRVNIYILTLLGVAMFFSLIALIFSYILFLGRGLFRNSRGNS